jgi:hypothetical protein
MYAPMVAKRRSDKRRNRLSLLLPRVLTQPHTVRTRLQDQLRDAISLPRISYGSHLLPQALHQLVFVHARLANALCPCLRLYSGNGRLVSNSYFTSGNVAVATDLRSIGSLLRGRASAS